MKSLAVAVVLALLLCACGSEFSNASPEARGDASADAGGDASPAGDGDASHDSSGDASPVDVVDACVPIAPPEEWPSSAPCEALAELVPVNFSIQNNSAQGRGDCSGRKTPDACTHCGADYSCACLHAHDVCAALSLTWESCRQDVEGVTPTVTCR